MRVATKATTSPVPCLSNALGENQLLPSQIPAKPSPNTCVGAILSFRSTGWTVSRSACRSRSLLCFARVCSSQLANELISSRKLPTSITSFEI
ncbi:hypothetical protein CEXT_366901 [Caerostris extrusa]|uniref:Uncharacterized protein n=1 Tax=Caerostris extrusa TaxID=172846 RepID=A0AAV4W4Y7_CAEEX|nr:hypothetical protein CEXT_366901 [Caerostris extrusa]